MTTTAPTRLIRIDAIPPAPAASCRVARRPHHRLAVAVLAGVSALGAGVVPGGAYAYFTSQGSGSGAATVGAVSAVSVVDGAAATTVERLAPGGTADVALQIQNTNPFPLTLVSVEPAAGSVTPDSAHDGCTTTGVSFEGASSVQATLAPDATTAVSLPGAASMDDTSSDACQGATFAIPVTITVEKQ
ncbi:MAG TPA: TasA family protein [Acidimicrobiales bacterium]|nr:TasA family protein [Acidimicrobiales bacterium]